jgi:EREBP-like factor
MGAGAVTVSERTTTSSSSNYTYMTVSSAPPTRRAGRTKFRETRHPVYKGVRRRGRSERWICELRDPNNSKSRIWVGTFATAEMAARAHDVAVLALRGPRTCLNFADSWRLTVPNSTSHGDIRRAAAVAAEQFRDSEIAPIAVDDRKEEQQPPVEMGAFDVDYDMDLNWGVEGYYHMAEGLLVDPPPPSFGWDENDGGGADASLWSFTY